MVTESSFLIKFPTYREKYLRERWPIIKKKLGEVGIRAELDLADGTMMVFTTRRTWDPMAILNARDVIKLLSRNVPLEQAFRLLEDGVACDIIKIRSMVRNVVRFIRRRQRLIGPEAGTLKCTEILTKCYVMVHGGTVSAIGSYKGLKEVRRIVEDCMNNIHPIYSLRKLMIYRELEKDPILRHQSWDRFIPKLKNKNMKSKRKAKKVVEKKKPYTPFPPPQLERKEDKEMASGEYFLKNNEGEEKKGKKTPKKDKKDRKEEKERQKRLSFIPPKEK